MVKEIPTARASRFDPLSLLWHVFAAPQTLMLFLGLLTLALVLTSVIPQIPPQSLSDPQPWLAVQSGPLASATSLVRVLGLYNVYHSFWFRLLLALTGLTLFVWILDSADLAWKVTRNKPWPPGAFAHWGSHPPEAHVLSFLDQEEAALRLRESLGRWGYDWSSVMNRAVPNFVAGRRGIVLWARPVALFSALVALIGLAAIGIWGWQGPEWQPAPGDVLPVGHGTPYHVRLDSYEPGSSSGNRVCDYRSRITWLQGEEPVAENSLAIGSPASFRGVAVRQVGYVPAVQLRVWDEDGRPVGLQPAGSEQSVPGRVDVVFPSPEAQPLILIPARDLVLSMAFEPSGEDGDPLLQVALVRESGTELEPVGTLSESGSLTAEGLQMDVNLSYRPVLQASRRPAMGLILSGLSASLVALFVGWLVPARLLWIAIAPGDEEETMVRLVALPGKGRDRWLPRLAARLRGTLSDES